MGVWLIKIEESWSAAFWSVDQLEDNCVGLHGTGFGIWLFIQKLFFLNLSSRGVFNDEVYRERIAAQIERIMSHV